MTLFGDWLKAARESHVDPETGEPWSQQHAADLIRAETGWKLARSALSAYETGEQQPFPANRRKLVDFWVTRGARNPDAAPDPEPVVLSVEERQLTLLERQVAAAERQAAAAEAQAASTAQLVMLVSASMPQPARDEVLARMGKDWYRQVMEPTPRASDPAPARVR